MLPPAALALEDEHVHGAPTLGRAFGIVRDRWRAGERERDLALHVAFLAWYLMLEPPHLTGLQADASCDFADIFREAHAWLLPRGAEEHDAEALYVVGLMASLSPWLLGDAADWTACSKTYRARYRELAPNGIAPSAFRDRGYYGHYFGQQAAIANGY